MVRNICSSSYTFIPDFSTCQSNHRRKVVFTIRTTYSFIIISFEWCVVDSESTYARYFYFHCFTLHNHNFVRYIQTRDIDSLVCSIFNFGFNAHVTYFIV